MLCLKLLTILWALCASSVCVSKSTCLGLQEWINLTVTQPKHPFCPAGLVDRSNTFYILYDINPPEGFNLRRDVYVRLAVFVRQLQRRPTYSKLRLVLPPWSRLYHWKSHHIEQDSLPWKYFFDIESLRRYAPVLDFPEFVEELKNFGLEDAPKPQVHKVIQLKHFKDMFENGVFKDKWEFNTNCQENMLRRSYLSEPYIKLKDAAVQCVNFQGSASLLKGVLDRVWSNLKNEGLPTVIAILNAEVVLHDHWADREFWRARRSMRFAENLMEIAADFRHSYFNSTDNNDKVQRPPMWEYENGSYKEVAIGGNYLCVHLRRGDFLHGREATTPTLKSSAIQIKHHLTNCNLSTVFLSTDATAFEIKNLKAYMPRVKVLRFATENLEQKATIKDGGIAIIDQLICSHAYYFVGTYESTFTYRIYEEREILGFPKDRTFNTLCKKSTMEDCSHNSVWSIAY